MNIEEVGIKKLYKIIRFLWNWTPLNFCHTLTVLQRGKRRRVKTSRYEIDFLENEEQKHIQQAIKNSLIEKKRVDIPPSDAPTYYPTVDEFHDVLKYIRKYVPIALFW